MPSTATQYQTLKTHAMLSIPPLSIHVLPCFELSNSLLLMLLPHGPVSAVPFELMEGLDGKAGTQPVKPTFDDTPLRIHAQ
jgi:hypothetical protein